MKHKLFCFLSSEMQLELFLGLIEIFNHVMNICAKLINGINWAPNWILFFKNYPAEISKILF